METREILAEREKTHGSYDDHAKATQLMKALFQGCKGYKDGEVHHRESLDMIAHKIGRILAGDPDFHDHWSDIAGYATLSADRCTK